MTQKYPLSWPDGWKRTRPNARVESRFQKTFGAVRKMLIEEVERLGASDLIISTNVPLRRDGLPYANGLDLADPGKSDWRVMLDVSDHPTIDEVESQFRVQAHLLHPDHGGDSIAFQELVKARDMARAELSTR